MARGKKHRTHTFNGSLSRELVEIVVSFDQSLMLLENRNLEANGCMTFQQYAQPLLEKIRRFKMRIKDHKMKVPELSGTFLSKYSKFLQGVDKGNWSPQQFCEQELELFSISKKLKKTPCEREVLPTRTRGGESIN